MTRRTIREVAVKAYNLGYRTEDAKIVAQFYRVPVSDLEREMVKLEERERK